MTVRVALVGCGAAARRLHLPGYRATGDVAVTIFASRSRASAQAARDEWGSGEVTDGWHDAVTRPDVDAVDICTPNALHAEIALAASAAGKHVLVEKPVATTLDDADAMVAAATRAGRLLMVAQQIRFAPAAAALHALLRSGELGAVRSVRALLGHPGPESWAQDASWFRNPTLAGGGVLLDLGIHLLDAVAWLAASPVTLVDAARLVGSGPVEDAADLRVRLGDAATAVPAEVSVSWLLPQGTAEIDVRCSGGTAELRSPTDLTVTLRGGVPSPVPVEERGPLDLPAAAFAQAIAQGGPAPVDGAAGRAALAAVLAAYDAARLGRAVAVAA